MILRRIWRWLKGEPGWALVLCIALVWLLLLAVYVGAPRCEGFLCPTWRCYTGDTCNTCFCMKRDWRSGICVDISQVPALEAQGWEVVP